MSDNGKQKLYSILKKNKRFIVGIATIFLILFMLFIVDFPSLINKIVKVGYLFLFLFCLTYTFVFLLKAYKLKLIFKGLNRAVHYFPCYFSIGTGYVINDFTPGKVGDLAKIFILKDQDDVKLSESVAGVSIERVFDVVFLFFITIAALIYIYISNLEYSKDRILLGQSLSFYLLIGTILIIFILGFFILLIYKTEMILKIIEKISPKLASYIGKFLNNFKKGIKKFKFHKKEFLIILFVNLLIWISDAFITVIFFYALGYELNVYVIMLAVIILFFSKTFPITPGGWGISENIGALFVFIFYPNILYTEILSVFIIDHLFRSAYLFFYGGYSIFHYNFNLKEAKMLTLEENINQDSESVDPNNNNNNRE